MPNQDIVSPGHLHAAPSLAEALGIVRGNPGVFGTGGTPTDLLRVLEWFVDPPCVLLLQDVPHGKLSSTHGCVCDGDAFQFYGIVVDPNVPKMIGHLRYDVSLEPGNERVHLDHYLKHEDPADPPMSMKPHLRRAYEGASGNPDARTRGRPAVGADVLGTRRRRLSGRSSATRTS